MKKFQSKTIEYVDTSTLVPYARNAKKHDKAQIAAIAASIKEFDFNNPVLIDSTNGIIAGHGRVAAAQLLNMEKVPCIRLGHLTETQKRAYILADNRLAEIGGGWDEEMLKLEIADLKDVDEEMLELVGWSDDEVADILADLPNEEAKGEGLNLLEFGLETDFTVESGQIWQVGQHLLVCAKIADQWPLYTKHLQPGMLFIPYGTPFILLCETKQLMVVNSEPYFCALMLTKAKLKNIRIKLYEAPSN